MNHKAAIVAAERSTMKQHLANKDAPETAHGPGLDEIDLIAAREGDAIRRAFRPMRPQPALKVGRSTSETGPAQQKRTS